MPIADTPIVSFPDDICRLENTIRKMESDIKEMQRILKEEIFPYIHDLQNRVGKNFDYEGKLRSSTLLNPHE